MDITKVVIPAAGRGTRFLPLTKSIPKEMIPLLEKPAIQLILEEGLQSAIKHYFFISSKNKTSIENYFDSDLELELFLKEQNRDAVMIGLERIRRAAQFTYIRQAEQLGLGHAVSLAAGSIGKEYFGVILPDDIIDAKIPALEQLMRIARQEKATVIAVQEVPTECVSSYGIIAIKKQITSNLFQVNSIIEKPAQKDAPSNLAVVGRYILSHKIFTSLEHTALYSTGEIQLTNAISHMIQNNEKVFAYKVQGIRYDIGNPIGWVKAIIGLALTHPQYAPAIRKFIADIDTTHSYLYNQTQNIEHTL